MLNPQFLNTLADAGTSSGKELLTQLFLFFLVAANIFYDILEAASPALVASVKPGGTLMLSGILKTQAKGCLATATKAGMIVQKVITRGKWVSAVGTVK